MGKLFIAISALILILLSQAHQTFAQEYSAGSSAALMKPNAEKATDSRVKILREYLEQYNSPLAVHAETFVKTADKYDLDWKFVAAISGLESTFGREIPYNSFNGWGWGIFGDNMIRFSSWDEGIETVSEGLRNKYMNKWGAQDVYAIGRFYASSPTWAQRVEHFMRDIEEFNDAKLATNLSISL
jgi:hypothetical protein